MLNIALFNRVSAFLLLVFMLAAPHIMQAQTDPRIDVLGTCIPEDPSTGGNASTKFFAHYEQTPDSVRWDFGVPEDPDNPDSLRSTHLHPIFTYQEANQYQVQLLIWSNGSADADTVLHTVDIQQTTEQLQIMDMQEEQPVQGEVVLCGEKTLQAQLSGEGGGGQGGGGQGGGGQPTEVTWYRPHSAGGVITAQEITVSSENTDADGRYLDAGTYYVVYDDEQGCPITQSFRVVIYNESTQNSSRWYFGDGAGIDFLNGASPVRNLSMRGDAYRAIEGNSMVGDENADVLFFSNGETVWYGSSRDMSEILARDGDNLAGSREVSQNSIFVEFPQDETLFYLFKISGEPDRGLYFSTLDLKADPPPPGMALSETAPTEDQPIKNILVHRPVAEKITTASRNGGGSWVIVHELGSNNFLSYPADEEGIGVPVVSSAGSVYGNSGADAKGYMRISGDGNILATTVNQGSTKFIELFRFNADSGQVSEPIQIPIEQSNGILYGLELSDSLIYATVTSPGGPSYLYQFKYDSTLNISTIQESQRIVETDAELGAVQRGPDGQIYIARNNEQYLYQLQDIYIDENFAFNSSNDFELLDDSQSTLGLPNFGAMAGTSPPDANLAVTPPYCFGDDVMVSGTQRYSTDKTLIFTYYKDSPNGQAIWTDPVDLQQQAPGGGGQGGPGGGQQGGGTSSTLPFSTYESLGPGTYFVKLEVVNECGIYPDPNNPEHEPIIEEFTISARPEAILKTDDILQLCDDQSVTFIGAAIIDGEEVSGTEASHFWLDELDNDLLVATGPEFSVSEAGAWKFFVMSSNGCSSDTLRVRADDLRPDADLGDDIVVCQGDQLPSQELSISVTNPQDFNYAWFLNGQDLSNNSTRQSLDGITTDTPGRYQYVVEVTRKDEEEGCFKADTMLITVAAEPQVQILASDNNCNGSAVLTAESRGEIGELSYQWEGPGISSGQGTEQIRINQSGEYRVTVTDEASGCSPQAIYTIDLDNPLADLELISERECGEAMYSLSLETGYTGSDLQIRWFRGSTELPEHNGQREGIIGEPGNTYRVEVTITSGECANTESDSEDLPTIGNEDVSLQSTYTICPTIPEMNSVRLSVPGFNRYQWSRIEANGQTATVSLDSIATIRNEGEYQLVVNDCEPVRFSVVADCTPQLFLPNAIRVSPNNPQNGIFKILNEHMLANIQQFQIIIMNRWGEVIFQSNDPQFEWRGTDRRGDLVMANTYVYIITYRDMFGDEQQRTRRQRGGITVLR